METKNKRVIEYIQENASWDTTQGKISSWGNNSNVYHIHDFDFKKKILDKKFLLEYMKQYSENYCRTMSFLCTENWIKKHNSDVKKYLDTHKRLTEELVNALKTNNT